MNIVNSCLWCYVLTNSNYVLLHSTSKVACDALCCLLFNYYSIKLLQIILSQEKNIQRLNEMVRSLKEQLVQCRGYNETRGNVVTPMTENVIELERQQSLDD